jgi:UDP-glucose 4-epimerase
MKLLVTGGAGYIGAHVVRALQREDHDVLVVDDLSTGVKGRLGESTPLVVGSILDADFLSNLMLDQQVEGVVHLAAKKAVEESVAQPLWYYHENVTGMQTLLSAMVRADVRKILFSSSAAVYGIPTEASVTEESATSPASPYGWTKLMSEQILRDTAAAEGFSWAALRYFNVGGAELPHLGDRGEKNLIPRVFRAVTAGSRPQIFGTDYPTRDGTCIRDYIHVSDVADAHAAVITSMAGHEHATTYNIGTGLGTSVLEVMFATRQATGINFSWDELPPRAGDPPEVIANATKIQAELGWQSRHDLDSIVRTSWRAWQVPTNRT